jgi:hypothetical protein
MRFSFAAAMMLTEGRNALPNDRYVFARKSALSGRPGFSTEESVKAFDHRKRRYRRKAFTDSEGG